MNRYDERDWRSDRDRNRDSDRDNGHYGFHEDHESGRTPSGDSQQPYSQNPYGYYPGQRSERQLGGPRRGEWRDTSSQHYGQREPYNTRESYGPRGGGESGSRYSESQYGLRRGREDSYGRDSQGGGPSGRGGRSLERWGETGTGSREPGYGGRGAFGEGPFTDASESPGYFGSGYYGDGGASYGGGFDQRSRTRHLGSLDQDPMDWRGPTRYRTGPKGYTRSDERLREDISERLMMAASVDSSDVSVSVKDAKVTLEGRVPDRRMKHSIEDLVDNCPGVQDIDNRIRVGRQATETIGGRAR